MKTALIEKIMRRESIPLRIRKKLRHLAGKPAPGKDYAIPFFEGVYYGHTGHHQDDKIYLYGKHEAATLHLLRAIIQDQRAQGKNPVYLDIGTNTGQHLLAAGLLADRAIGFEPWEQVRRQAEDNIRRNALNHISVMPYGLADQDGEFTFYPPSPQSLGGGSFRLQGKKDQAPVLARTRRGDDVANELGLAPTLIKIDAEGYEKHILEGLKVTLEKFRPAVVFEYSSITRQDFPDKAAMASVFPKGYKFEGILPSREFPRLTPFRPCKKFENILASP